MTEGYVMAYTADGCDLITITCLEAEKAGLKIIRDPWLDAQTRAEKAALKIIRDPWLKAQALAGKIPMPCLSLSGQNWGPYHCPSCGNHRLQLLARGNWD